MLGVHLSFQEKYGVYDMVWLQYNIRYKYTL